MGMGGPMGMGMRPPMPPMPMPPMPGSGMMGGLRPPPPPMNPPGVGGAAPLPPREAPPPMPEDERDSKRPRTEAGFVLEPEEEFLLKFPGEFEFKHCFHH